MQQLPLADTDTGVAALMRLVTIMTSEVLHCTVISDYYFIDGKEAETLSFEL